MRSVFVRARRHAAAVLALALVLLAAPASAQSPSFAAFIESLWPEARTSGVSRPTFDAAFAGVAIDNSLIGTASSQREFVQPLWDYVDSFVTETRINNGRQMLQTHAGLLAEIEAEYGVSRYVVVAIWGIETNYGAILSASFIRDVVRSLATLAYAGGSRAEFGRTQLIAALRILETGVVAPRQMTGSWAGATGHTQFIPTTYEAYAVDFDGDGRRDVWNTLADALGSTANYLAEMGWREGETWGYEVTLSSNFNYALGDQATSRTVAEWVALGVGRPQGRTFPRPDDRATLWIPAGANGPGFLLLANFSVIKRYNNANSYALAVGHLADRLLGMGTFAQAWPREEMPLTTSQRRELQSLLNVLGYDAGTVDGVVGPKTISAIRSWQLARGLTPDGYPSTAALERLRREG